MKLTQQFAMLNRKAMVDVIMAGMGLTAVETFTTVHNYIDTDAMILRKGSVSARSGEKLLIPCFRVFRRRVWSNMWSESTSRPGAADLADTGKEQFPVSSRYLPKSQVIPAAVRSAGWSK